MSRHTHRWAFSVLEEMVCWCIFQDLKSENILVGIENASVLEQVAEDEVVDPSPRKICGDRTVYLSRNDFGIPGQAPKAPKITDFDNAIRGDGSLPLVHHIQPDPYRAPEVTLGASWTYSADIWNLGVMVCPFVLSYQANVFNCKASCGIFWKINHCVMAFILAMVNIRAVHILHSW